MVVVHYTVLDARASLERLCDPEAEVSCHWLVSREGAVTGLVGEDRRAWHAGRARWGNVTDVNSRSVGIELENDGERAFPEGQMDALTALLREVVARHRVPPERVLGHSDVSVGRKRDPGPRFDWRGLARLGLAVWPERVGEGDPAALQGALDTIGYDPDAEPESRLAAFRLRFRPGAAGSADATDAGIAAAVAERWPCAAG